MKKLIAGNWKMHKSCAEAELFLEKISKQKFKQDVLICPPFTMLCCASDILKNSEIIIGAQNMYYEDTGAFTGEISPLMLKECGCKFVIIGHSERRHIFGENNELIHKKVISALKHGFIPILCVGETHEQRNAGYAHKVIHEQISLGLEKVKEVADIVIAYEPVWAIGTGVNATIEQAEEIHRNIRKLLAEKFGEKTANKVRIIYGGSVTAENAFELLHQKDIDGVLVGGASLNLKDFTKIIESSE